MYTSKFSVGELSNYLVNKEAFLKIMENVFHDNPISSGVYVDANKKNYTDTIDTFNRGNSVHSFMKNEGTGSIKIPGINMSKLKKNIKIFYERYGKGKYEVETNSLCITGRCDIILKDNTIVEVKSGNEKHEGLFQAVLYSILFNFDNSRIILFNPVMGYERIIDASKLRDIVYGYLTTKKIYMFWHNGELSCTPYVFIKQDDHTIIEDVGQFKQFIQDLLREGNELILNKSISRKDFCEWLESCVKKKPSILQLGCFQ